MALHPQTLSPVPEATAAAVHPAFPKGNLYVELGADFGALYDDRLFADLYTDASQETAREMDLYILDKTVLESEKRRFQEHSGQVCHVVEQLINDGERALSEGSFSVVNKTVMPPSGDRHDYFHPSPYYWPNPNTHDGFPFIYRDGKRSPDTVLCAPGSDKYDRTRLQKMFDNTFVLTLAHYFSDDDRYAQQAATLLRTWFIDPPTRMNPHLQFAQCIPRRSSMRGEPAGVIETKDMYFLLDAVRLLQATTAWSDEDSHLLKAWMADFLHWLRTSRQGRRESWAANNHGTYYDLQTASVALFTDNNDLARRLVRRTRRRLFWQLNAIGVQRLEMRRSITFHYCCYNLHGLVHIACLAEKLGVNLWHHECLGKSLKKALLWLLSFLGKEWPYRQIEPWDPDRLYPLLYMARKKFPDTLFADAVEDKYMFKPLFHPHDGIRPYWLLGL